ncbi:KRAB-A domain-containing protein 2-like [Leptinotarsa decemlineata]|uniref:KRAB-A domain-containing protein 2-like n=1 Tax=Leptinotarsa decemlineata TaxID=7539 RepID=UPI003D30622B
MLAETSKKYANITKEMISPYLSMCDVCQQKKTKKKRGLVSKPILHSEMNSRCQVDLIDFPGAPCILQSDNGREFVNNVISELATLWPELEIVHGKPRHSQSQGSVERANQDLENMISSWLKDNNSTKWSEGLRYVQFMKNRAFHSGIKQSPYKALFGIEPRVGLSTSSLPQEIINDLQDEDDLRKVIKHDSNSNHSEDGDGGVVEIDTQNIKDARITAAKNLKKTSKKNESFFRQIPSTCQHWRQCNDTDSRRRQRQR